MFVWEGFCVFVAEYGGILEACLHSAHPASVAMVIHLSPKPERVFADFVNMFMSDLFTV